ncbi:hypothetical protein [Roseomonas indoligenes]|uniref:Uncharacterized protein n=1 Tax=Roseomonas indoligenes TaxID=2820811 RepID=A0A940S404_9PROT|nr:hypothetical protein [Pararoseomonas indoligenes]MBP0492776.1 hypothetical protein [Pararoseomonas indoligenes]
MFALRLVEGASKRDEVTMPDAVIDAPLATTAEPIRVVHFDPALYLPLDAFWGITKERLPVLAEEVGVDLRDAVVFCPGEDTMCIEAEALNRLMGADTTLQEAAALVAMLTQVEWRAGPGRRKGFFG